MLKNNKYSDHIISNAFYNAAKLQDIAPKPKNNFNNIPLVTTFHEDIDNKIIILKEKLNTPIWLFISITTST